MLLTEKYRYILRAAKCCFLSLCLLGSAFTYAQNSPPIAQTGPALPADASAKKADEFLATLRPPTSFKALLSGNDLLLDVPDIARAGSVKAKAVSTIARTDAMWLMSLHAMPDSGNALFVGLQFDMSALPEATLNLQLYKTQMVLLVARAGGKYYGTFREVKVGQSNSVGANRSSSAPK
jgi:hypothetical protein